MKVFCFRFLLIFILSIDSAFCLSPEERLNDESQESRAMSLFLKVRCLSCGGQVIENSDSKFSFNMRKLIRSKISEGRTDKQIEEELVKEFGPDILVVPSEKNYISFFLLIFLISSVFLVFFIRPKIVFKK